MTARFQLFTWTTTFNLTVDTWLFQSAALRLEAVSWVNVRTTIPRASITTLRAGLASRASEPPLVWDMDPVLRPVPVALGGTDDYETGNIGGAIGRLGPTMLYLPPCDLCMAVFIAGAPIAAGQSFTMTMLARRAEECEQ